MSAIAAQTESPRRLSALERLGENSKAILTKVDSPGDLSSLLSSSPAKAEPEPIVNEREPIRITIGESRVKRVEKIEIEPDSFGPALPPPSPQQSATVTVSGTTGATIEPIAESTPRPRKSGKRRTDPIDLFAMSADDPFDAFGTKTARKEELLGQSETTAESKEGVPALS